MKAETIATVSKRELQFSEIMNGGDTFVYSVKIKDRLL